MPEIEPSATPSAHVIAIVNARVWTGDPMRPWADAVLVLGDTILAVGSSAELRKRAGADATVIDARGMMVLPHAAAGRLGAGLRANLVIVERPPDTESPAQTIDETVVFSLVDGLVVVDLNSLAP
jgi:predicted amidohydrolase YtcJ